MTAVVKSKAYDTFDKKLMAELVKMAAEENIMKTWIFNYANHNFSLVVGYILALFFVIYTKMWLNFEKSPIWAHLK